MSDGILYSDVQFRAVTEHYTGQGSSAVVWHPETILTCLRNLERWTRGSLLRRRTKLQCFQGCGIQRLKDAYPNRTALLACGHRRPVHTLSDDEHCALIERAKGLKGMKRGRSGFTLVTVEDIQ